VDARVEIPETIEETRRDHKKGRVKPFEEVSDAR